LGKKGYEGARCCNFRIATWIWKQIAKLAQKQVLLRVMIALLTVLQSINYALLHEINYPMDRKK